jgi:hypothetical protein
MEPTAWSLKGDVLENCSCEVVCPGHFSFRNRCTHDYCRAVWAFRVRTGVHGPIDLSGLNLVVIGDTPPYMIDGDWKVGIYLDERCDDGQARALERIYTGEDGGPWATLSRFVGTRLPTRRVSIGFEEDSEGRPCRVEIPGVLTAEASFRRGHDESKSATLVNLFNTLYEPVHVVAKGSFEYRDHGFDWKPEKHGNHAIQTTFDWAVEPAA